MEQVISADRDEWVPVFTGLSVRQFRKLVRIVAGRGGEQTGTGRRWRRPLDHLAPLLALTPITRRHGPGTVLIVDGTLVPTHDRTVTAQSKTTGIR